MADVTGIKNEMDQAVDKLLEETKMDEKKTEKQSWIREKQSWIRENADVVMVGAGFGLLAVTLVGSIIAGIHQNKLQAELYNKAIDADLEAAKYAEDKKLERETKISSNIKDIVHDITNKNN
jgi:hypothetical protein